MSCSIGSQHILLWQPGVFGTTWFMIAMPLPFHWHAFAQVGAVLLHASASTWGTCANALQYAMGSRLVGEAHDTLHRATSEVLIAHGYPPDANAAVQLGPLEKCLAMVVTIQVGGWGNGVCVCVHACWNGGLREVQVLPKQGGLQEHARGLAM